MIEHEGVVLAVEGGTAKVQIEQTSACAGCHAKSACTAFDKKEKVVDAIIDGESIFHVGERVLLQGKKSIGFKAVMIAFVVPFLLILATLVVLSLLTVAESVAAFASLSILVPYYFVIFLFRNRIQREFKFYVVKMR